MFQFFKLIVKIGLIATNYWNFISELWSSIFWVSVWFLSVDRLIDCSKSCVFTPCYGRLIDWLIDWLPAFPERKTVITSWVLIFPVRNFFYCAQDIERNILTPKYRSWSLIIRGFQFSEFSAPKKMPALSLHLKSVNLYRLTHWILLCLIDGWTNL